MIYLVFGIVGVIFTAIGVYIVKRDKAYNQNSSLITGEIIEIREQAVETSEGNRTRHLPVVKYFSQESWWRFEGDDQGGHFLKSGDAVQVRLQNGNHKIARLEMDISSLGNIAYMFIGGGVLAVIFALVMFEPVKFQFNIMWFAPVVGVLYIGTRVWPSISNVRQLPMFEESKKLEENN